MKDQLALSILRFACLLWGSSATGSETLSGFISIPEEPTSEDPTSIPIIMGSGDFDSEDGGADPITDFLIGILLIGLAIPWLWFNERRAIKEQMVILSSKKICVEASPREIDPYNDQEMVSVGGTSTTDEVLTDPYLAVQESGLARLKRVVEVYQMVESTTRENNTTHYHYNKEWKSIKIDSSNFHKHDRREDNQGVIFIVPNEVQNNKNVSLGQFTLAVWQIEKLDNFTETIHLSHQNIDNMNEDFRIMLKDLPWENSKVTASDNYIYIKRNSNIDIGDMRISYKGVKCGPVTVIAQQNGNSFIPYNIATRRFRRKPKKSNTLQVNPRTGLISGDERGSTSDCVDALIERACCCCYCCCRYVENMKDMQEDKVIDYVFPATYTKDEAFKEKQEEENSKTWFNRVIGWVALWGGMWLLFSPIIYLFSFFAFLANLLWLAAGIISFLVSLPVALIIIEISWFVHRPKLALATITLCGIAIGLVIGLTRTG